MDKIFIFLLCFYFCSAKIKINKLDVPSAILYGSRKDVVLDCNFESGNDTVTELKWFLNGDTLLYQWLPTSNKSAQAAPQFKNHIDENYYKVGDKSATHWPLHITELTTEFSGNYTCKVSSPFSEDEQTKRMIIYVIPEDDDDDVDDNDDDNIYDDDDDDFLDVIVSKESSEITCSSGGLFPQPNLTLYIARDNNNDTEIIFRQDDETFEQTEDGLYNVTASLTFDLSNLTQNVRYICELNIPGTPYNISEEGTLVMEDDSEITEILSEDVTYLDLFNSTNSTDDSSCEEEEVFNADIETQIEEELDFFTTTTETTSNDDVTKEETRKLNGNASLKHLPSLLPTAVMIILLSLLNL